MVFTDYGHPERVFFKNLKLLGLGSQIGLKFFDAFRVFSGIDNFGHKECLILWKLYWTFTFDSKRYLDSNFLCIRCSVSLRSTPLLLCFKKNNCEKMNNLRSFLKIRYFFPVEKWASPSSQGLLSVSAQRTEFIYFHSKTYNRGCH